jgi:thiol-disulfide isomerase/thioredoxin
MIQMGLRVREYMSEGCHACQATKPLWHDLKQEFIGEDIEFQEMPVAVMNPIERLPEDDENFNADMLDEKFAIPIDEDETLSLEEKENYRKQGITKAASMPTFVITDDDGDIDGYEVIAGGVGENHTIKEDKEWKNDMRKMILKWLAKKQGLRLDVEFYGTIWRGG